MLNVIFGTTGKNFKYSDRCLGNISDATRDVIPCNLFAMNRVPATFLQRPLHLSAT